MWQRSIGPRRARLIAIVGVVAASSIVLADRYLGDRAPWRPGARHRAEVEALARGHALLDQGRFRQAIRTVSAVQTGGTAEAEALTIRGIAEASLEEVAPARRDLERAWQLRPNAAAARVLAAIYLSAGETERGFQMLLSASRIDPDDYRPWYAMGELVHRRLGHDEPAIAAFREALRRRPDHLESRLGLVEALIRLHRPQQAESILEGVLRERPDDPGVATRAAEVALELGRDHEAARLLERSLASDPDHRDALILLARLQVRRGRPREALAAAEHACALEPNDPAALGLLGMIQAALGLKDQAAWTRDRRREVERRNRQIEGLQRTILEHPNDPEPRCRLGRAAAEAGLRTLAMAALALAPDCQPARQGLIDLGLSPDRLPPAGGAGPAAVRRR
jgi:tetratricopeptide (TPR) repeat protein